MIFFTIFAKGRGTGGFIYTGASFKRRPCLQSKVIKRCGTETPDEEEEEEEEEERRAFKHCHCFQGGTRSTRLLPPRTRHSEIVVVASVHRGTMYFGRNGALNSSFCFLLPFHSDNRVSHA
ncbi:hypothetical protein QQF64_035549 [Cirrhinus molitorella]|uniref:Secreted protein n=1 Tax=Cirrhinus molitorella TaxID=172907 RepID=A0ABR3NGI1_9TELE